MSEISANAETVTGLVSESGPAQPSPANSEIVKFRSALYSSLAPIVLLMMATPRYRDLPLRDLEQLVLEPLMCDRIAIATRNLATPQSEDLVGIAVWATVSAEVDERIKGQIAAGVFPLRLRTADWVSGNTIWLIDILAGSPENAAEVFSSLSKVFPPRSSSNANANQGIRIHPAVRNAVGAEMLARLGATPSIPSNPREGG